MRVTTSTWCVAPGQAGSALSRAIAMARDATVRSGHAVSAWIDVYSAPPPAVTFAGVSADALAMLAGFGPGRAFTGVGVERVGEQVASAGAGGRSPLFAEVTTARSRSGAVVDVLGWAVESSADTTRRTELRTSVLRTTADDGATTIARITLANSLRELDDALQLPVDDLSALACLGVTVRRRVIRRLR
jgi:hypothetical protein